MRKFLYRCALFALPLLVAAVLTEAGLRRIPNDYASKFGGLTERLARVETLVLGSSHAYYGISPAELPGPAYSLAMVSQSVDIDAALLRHYLDRAPRLRRVVLPLNYPVLRYRLGDSPEAWRLKNYNVYGPTWLRWSPAALSEVTALPFPANVGRLRRYYLAGRAPSLTTSANGMGVHPQIRSPEFAASGAKAAHRHRAPGPADGTLVDALNDIARRCNAAGIWLHLVRTPALPDYSRRLDAAQLAEVDTLATRLARRHARVSFLTEPAAAPYADSLFRDADHLNRAGAQAYSQRLGRAIRAAEAAPPPD